MVKAFLSLALFLSVSAPAQAEGYGGLVGTNSCRGSGRVEFFNGGDSGMRFKSSLTEPPKSTGGSGTR